MKKEQTEATRERVLSFIDGSFESDAAFERELGLPAKTVNNWRRGKSASFMRMLPSLAEVLEVSVGELLDVPIQRDTSELSEDEIELLSLYRKASILSAKQRVALASTLERVITLYIDSASDKGRKAKRG